VSLEICFRRFREMPDLLAALEGSRVDDGRGHENELLEEIRKRAMNRENLMQSETGERRDANDRRRQIAIESRRRDRRHVVGSGHRREDVVETAHASMDA